MHNLQIQLTRFNLQEFYEQGSTNKNTFKHRSCYSPTSSQGRALVEQASVVAYLTRFAVKLFSLRFAQCKKTKKYYQRATYEDNFSTFPQPRFFGSRVAVSQETSLVEVLDHTSLFLRGSHMQKHYRKRTTLRSKSSTIKGLLYAPYPKKRKKGMLSDQPQLLCITSTALLCC